MNHNNNNLEVALSIERQSFFPYIIQLVFFVTEWIFAAFLVSSFMDFQDTFIFYIIFFQSAALFIVNYIVFFCIRRSPKRRIETTSEWCFMMLSNLVSLSKNLLRFFILFAVKLQLVTAPFPILYLFATFAHLLVPNHFEFPRASKIAFACLTISSLAVLPLFIFNESILAVKFLGVILIVVLYGFEVLDYLLKHVLEFSMLQFVDDKRRNNCCCWSTSSTTADIDAALDHQEKQSRPFTSPNVVHNNSLFTAVFAFIGMILFEVEQYTIIFEHQEYVGFVALIVLFYVISNVFFTLYLEKTTAKKRTVLDWSLKFTLVTVFTSIVFLVHTQLWHVLAWALALVFFCTYCASYLSYDIKAMICCCCFPSSSTTTTPPLPPSSTINDVVIILPTRELPSPEK